MLTIKQTSQDIFEGVIERHMDKLVRTITNDGTTLKLFFGKNNQEQFFTVPRFDKIDASCVHVYTRLKPELKKRLNNAFKNERWTSADQNDPEVEKTMWVFWIGDDLLCLYYDGQFYFKNKFEKYRRGLYIKKRNKYLEYIEYCHPTEIWEVTLEGGTTYSQRKSRREAREGMIVMDQATFKKIADENRKRYTLLAQKMRQEKGTKFDVLFKQVQQELERSMQNIMDFHKNMKKYCDKDWAISVGINEDIAYLYCREMYNFTNEMNSYMRNTITYICSYVENEHNAITRSEYYYNKVDYKYKLIEEKYNELKKYNDKYELFIAGKWVISVDD